MRTIRTTAWMAPVACLLAAMTANAQHAHHQSRTYMAPPGSAEYTRVKRPANPWNTPVFRLPCCRTPEERRAEFVRQYQLVEIAHTARLDSLDWAKYEDYVNPPPNSLSGYLTQCGANGCGANGCSDCAEGKCRKHHVGHKGCKNGDCGGCSSGCHDGASGFVPAIGRALAKHRNRRDRSDVVVPPYSRGGAMGYPAMNREDATRYIEGMMYYPPYHIVRSPRDFYMLDVTQEMAR